MEKPIFLTADKYENARLSDADRTMMDQFRTGQGLVQLTPDMLEEMAKQAKATYEKFDKHIRSFMNKEKAQHVFDLRVGHRYTWRSVAVAFWTTYPGCRWNPPTNQIAGMILCRVAGEILGKVVD